MPKIQRGQVWLLAVALVSSFVLTGCTKKGDPTQATVILHNSSPMTYSLWIGHREPTPADQLPSGGQVGTAVTLETIHNNETEPATWDDQIKLNAKRPNVEDVIQQTIYPDGLASNPTIIINWDGKNFSQQK